MGGPLETVALGAAAGSAAGLAAEAAWGYVAGGGGWLAPWACVVGRALGLALAVAVAAGRASEVNPTGSSLRPSHNKHVESQRPAII